MGVFLNFTQVFALTTPVVKYPRIANYFLKQTYGYLNLNFSTDFIDTQNFIWKNYTSKNRFTYLIDLNNSEQKLLENLSSEKLEDRVRKMQEVLEGNPRKR